MTDFPQERGSVMARFVAEDWLIAIATALLAYRVLGVSDRRRIW